jgi:hypothetical protein
MNKKDRDEWDKLVDEALKAISEKQEIGFEHLFVEVNKHILALERKLHQFRRGTRVAAILRKF